MLAGLTSCSWQAKFEPLYRAARALDGALAVGTSYADFNALLQRFATEMIVADDRAQSQGEKELVGSYRDLFVTYKESATVWKHQIDSAKYDWLKGDIFVDAELRPIIAKYKLSKSELTREYPRTYETIPGDSVQRVWEAVGPKSKKAVSLYFRRKN
jgi:hypothetical protein